MDLLAIRTLPFLARRNYYYEFKHIVPWCILAGLVEGQFAGIIISRTFHGGDLLIGIAATTPTAAYLFSIVWGMLCIGRPKIRLFTGFVAATALCTGIAGAVPASPVGAVWFIGQMAAAQVLLTGVVTIRSAVWKSNYPHTTRGRITARLQAVRIVVGNVAVLVVARVCDWDAMSYRYVFPCAALFGLLSIFPLARVRVRGERRELGRHRTTGPNREPERQLVEPFTLTALLSPGHVLGQMVRVLRNDRRFTQYCIAQMLTGIANLMTVAIVVAVVTQDMDLGDRWGFWISTALIQVLQRLAMLVSIGRWAGLFDRMGVVRFRVINVACWGVSLVFGMIATLVTGAADRIGAVYLPIAVASFAFQAMFSGFGLGGGALAHTLGHLHFARPQEAEIYMGIHVSLIGLRGLIAPLCGMWLFRMIGWPVWVIAIAFSIGSIWMYGSLARYERRAGIPAHPHDMI